MKISLNTIRGFLDFELPETDELVRKIGAQLGEVEEVVDLGDKYKDALIVRVVECAKHPDADRLNVTKIDDGGVVQDVPRDENGLVQVVCGAPNVRADMLAVWLPPKSIVPSSYGDNNPFVLEARELRGVLSQGMLAAADELALGSDHEGILEINPTELNCDPGEVKAGASFAKLTSLDDTIIDIENKMFTHRPDCFGQLGVAREIAGILGHKFTSPSWYLDQPTLKNASGLELEVFNDATDKVPRFMALAMKNVTIKPSPLWLQAELVRLGSKSINNVVDITNYVMLTTAQPTHAYDYDKIRGHKLGARMAQKGEKVHLLNDKTYELAEDDIVIADGEGPVGLAGIMGGGDSEVDASTKNIILEVATFDMYSVRKSSMRHGLFTDALTRFNKGQSPLQNNIVLARLASLMTEIVGAQSASQVFDNVNGTLRTEPVDPKALCIFDWRNLDIRLYADPDFINARLGTALSTADVIRILSNVEIEAYEQPHPKGADSVEIRTPFWRTDIEIPEDVVEEVGRLYGYDKLSLELPRRSIQPARKNQLLELKQSIRNSLASAGANEVLTYSFVDGKLLEKAGQDKKHAYQLANALSPDLQYYRLSLAPSLLDKVHGNIKAGYDKFAIFELGKGHIVGQLDDDKLPREDQLLALVLASSDKARPKGAAFYQARKYITDLLGDDITFGPVPADAKNFDIAKPYDQSRSAFVYHADKFLGIIGEFTAVTRRNLKLPAYCAGFELDVETLGDLVGQTSYQPLSKYPSVDQDITLKIDSKTSYGELTKLLETELEKLKPASTTARLSPLGIYQKDDDSRQISYRLSIASHEKTMVAAEVNQLLDDLATVASDQIGATRI